VTSETPWANAVVLNGSVLVLIQLDVGEELRLDRLQTVKEGSVQHQPKMKHAAPA
jgi:hypothetical protein